MSDDVMDTLAGISGSALAELRRQRPDVVKHLQGSDNVIFTPQDDGGFTREDACCSPTETIDARGVAQRVGVRHYVVDLEARFRAAEEKVKGAKSKGRSSSSSGRPYRCGAFAARSRGRCR